MVEAAAQVCVSVAPGAVREMDGSVAQPASHSGNTKVQMVAKKGQLLINGGL
jgi:hypothetical protein